MQSRKLYYFLAVALIWLMCSCAGSRYGTSKNSRLHYAYKHKGRLLSAKQQCDRAMRKKYKRKNRKVFAWANRSKKSSSSSSSTALAEVDPNDTPPPPKPKPTPKPEEDKVAERLHGEKFEDISIEKKHQIEDEVFKENNIPPPSTEEHERIRSEVEERIANESFPQDLEPLYFLHDDDEFSVVDMEPFLVAVEYALQGRMILIEGHTDASGADNYNVKLSIQRVEKIRKLMHDMGVPDERISVIGYGEELAEENEESKSAGETDRRVDFRVF